MLTTTLKAELEKWEGSYPKGWRTLVEKCMLLLVNDSSVHTIDQIKEKFGALRFYYTTIESNPPSNVLEDNLRERIWELEAMCGHICEECGTTLDVTTGPLDPMTRGWIHTYCIKCRTYLLAAKDLTK